MVRELVARGKELGFNTMRTWAHAVNAQYATQASPRGGLHGVGRASVGAAARGARRFHHASGPDTLSRPPASSPHASCRPSGPAQTAPGVFSEPALRGLDLLLDEARKAGIRVRLGEGRRVLVRAHAAPWVQRASPSSRPRCPWPSCSSSTQLILAFTSNWTPTGGIPEYLKWAGTDQQASAQQQHVCAAHCALLPAPPQQPCAPSRLRAHPIRPHPHPHPPRPTPPHPTPPQVDFYTRDDIKGWYRGWVEAVVNRVNTINGRTYKDDPTVLAWVGFLWCHKALQHNT